jgi:hypothetical protein
VVRRTHHCRRCGAAIEPGDVYAVVDVLDAEGRIRELLCRSCGAGLRAFVDGDDRDGRDDGDGTDGTDGGDDGNAHDTEASGPASPHREE